MKRADRVDLSAQHRDFVLRYIAAETNSQPLVKLLPKEVVFGQVYRLPAERMASVLGRGSPWTAQAGELVVQPGVSPGMVRVKTTLAFKEALFGGSAHFALKIHGEMDVEVATRMSRRVRVVSSGKASGQNNHGKVTGTKRMVMEFESQRVE
ncbi:MAG: hypothetical protein MJE77_24830 [Proteobacteria bacterium]|nr:hypothetical protein [Pseudomonadota bacterium]